LPSFFFVVDVFYGGGNVERRRRRRRRRGHRDKAKDHSPRFGKIQLLLKGV
jgi:hypothetical protein